MTDSHPSPHTPEPATQHAATADPTSRWQQRIEELFAQYPDIEQVAEEYARQLLTHLGCDVLEPKQIYWHWFDSANTSSRTFTGWEHYGQPSQSMTLTELVMRRFDLEQQRDSDLLAQMGGFYTADENTHAYNEHNEVRLDPRQVLAHFWSRDFSALYASRLRGFWINQQDFYRTVSKISMLCCATLQFQQGDLALEDFIEVYGASVNDPSSPFRPEKMSGDIISHSSTLVRALDVAGFQSQSILRFCTGQGREILYCAMQRPPFVRVDTEEQLYEWLQRHCTTASDRESFGYQFVRPEHDKEGRWKILQGHLEDIANTPWKQRKTALNQNNRQLDGYRFDFLATQVKGDMEQDAKYLLTSNSQLRKSLWIGYLDSFLKLYGAFSVLGWPLAAVSIGAGLVDVALYTDKAINAVNDQERNAAIRSAVLHAISVILTLPLLSDASMIAQFDGLDIEAAAEGDEVLVVDEETVIEQEQVIDESSETDGSDLSDSDLDSGTDGCSGSSSCSSEAHSLSEDQLRDIDLANWRPALLRNTDFKPHQSTIKGLYVRRNTEVYAQLRQVLYRVRYLRDAEQWAIVDPLNPYGDEGYIALSLDAQSLWLPGARVRPAPGTQPQLLDWEIAAPPLVDVPPLETPIRVEVPLDGVEKIMDRYMVRTAERGSLLAVYDADEQAWRANHLGYSDFLWRTEQGAWHAGDRQRWVQQADQTLQAYSSKTVVLPPLPTLPRGAQAIPRNIHYLWLGHALPSDELIANMIANAAKLTGYTSVLHIDLDTEALMQELTERFAKVSHFEVKPLAGQPFFKALNTGESAAQYAACRSGIACNYAAASDVLRYPLLDAYGGIYMDVDNTFVNTVSDLELAAGPSDLLLDDAVVHDDIAYRGYNSHVLGSHPDNPVLKAIIRSMQERYRARPEFYASARPTLVKDATPAQARVFWQYVKDTFAMTGPQLLDDVLRQTRPDYYDLALRPELDQWLGISSQEYELRLLARVQHYLPFANRAEVLVGSQHSWKSTR